MCFWKAPCRWAEEGRKGGGVVKEGACRGMDEGCACACICVLVILKAEANSLSFISCTRPPLTPCLFPSIYISWKLNSVWNKTLKKLLSERGRVQTSPCVFFVFSFFFFFFFLKTGQPGALLPLNMEIFFVHKQIWS